ncbi:MAG: mucoidy inhibitor MuiA family protein [Deltaproteobacteria bacterium]
MRRVAVIAFCLTWPAVGSAADFSVPSRVDAVTIFPQGAEVSRVAKVKLEKGLHTVILSDVPADAVPNSIRVEGLATGKLEIGSVDSRRLMVPSTDVAVVTSERRRIEDEIQILRDQRSTAEAQLNAAQTQRDLINNLSQLPSRPAPTQGAERGEDWSQILTTIATGSLEAQRNAVDAQVKMRALDRQIDDLEKKLQGLSPSEQERTEVKVHVDALAPLDADLVVRYQVPAASWTPLYDARLATGDKTTAPSLSLIRRAEIRQSSGESWDNAALTLSTTRPNASAGIPELNSITIDFEAPPPPPRPVAAAPVPEAAQAKRMALPEAAGDATSAEMAPPAEAIAVTPRQANVATSPFQAVFAVPGRGSVPNTGEAKRVQLLVDKIEPQLSVKTVPREETKAYLYATLVLPAGTPLLPGPVSLFRDGTFVGAGTLPIVSPGEKHELGFGVDDLIRVKHALVEEKRGETGLISTSRTDVRQFKITVKNLHERAMPVTVIDQMPVSNNADIKVEAIGGTRPTKIDVDDRRGVVAWDLKIDADEEEVIDFSYRVVWPSAKTITYR